MHFVVSVYYFLFILFYYYIFSYPYFPFAVVMSQIKAMAEDLQPLLAEVRDSGLLKEVENLTRSLTQASEDLRLICKPLWLLFYL